MSALTLFLLQYGFLLVLWVFVFVLIFALRADVFGTRVRKLPDPQQPHATTPTPPAVADPQAQTVAHDISRSPAPAPVSATAASASRIVITSGPKEGLEIPLGSEPLTIGRSSESGLVIRDDYTSSHHARLVRYADQWMIQDLDSTNGTFHDDQRVSPNAPVAVKVGAPIRVGQTTFELRK